MINKMQIFAASSILSVFATSIFASNGDGWYTQDQASHGHLLFNNYCAECHRPDLTGAIGPALKGKIFHKRWDGKNVGDMLVFEHKNMPAVNPGSMSMKQLLLITSYILSKNGYPSGNHELTLKYANTLTISN